MNKIIKRFTLILFVFALILIGMSTVIKAEDTNFSLDKTTLSVKLNSNGYLKYNNKPSGEKVTWESSNPNVATVNDGTIKGVSIGTATITATAAGQTARCEVSVVYGDLTIKGNDDLESSSIDLILEEHTSENLKVTVKDGRSEIVNNATVAWTSSNPSVATVDNTGKITAVSVGKTNVTASAAGISKTKEVNVLAAPIFTDFSNAKYELLFDTNTDLKISGIEPKDDYNNSYYCVITSSNEKPSISLNKYGSVDTELSKNVKWLRTNSKEKYIYTSVDEYVELNQDLYLWVVQDIKLEKSYNDSERKPYFTYYKICCRGRKIDKAKFTTIKLNIKVVYHRELGRKF